MFSSLFSPSLFFPLHSIKILIGGGVVGSTPSLDINIDTYVYTCITCIVTAGVYFYLGKNKGAGTFWSLGATNILTTQCKVCILVDTSLTRRLHTPGRVTIT